MGDLAPAIFDILLLSGVSTRIGIFLLTLSTHNIKILNRSLKPITWYDWITNYSIMYPPSPYKLNIGMEAKLDKKLHLKNIFLQIGK